MDSARWIGTNVTEFILYEMNQLFDLLDSWASALEYHIYEEKESTCTDLCVHFSPRKVQVQDPSRYHLEFGWKTDNPYVPTAA